MAEYRDECAPIIRSAKGVFLEDIEGRRYYDGVSSLWCNVHGHRHPVIDQAIRDQLERVAHSTLLGLGSVPPIELAGRLGLLTGLPHVFYADSGSAAVEIAMKVAFQYCLQNGRSPRTKFVALRNSYHGDTIGSVSVGGIDLFHSLFRPLLFEALFAPAPYPYRWPTANCAGDCLAALESLLDRHAGEIAAVVMEPRVQGAAGIIVHPDGFLREVRRLTRERGVFLICDEVATGFGRTGKMFAIEHEGVLPDALVLGKGLTGGYLPLSAALFSDELYRGFLGDYVDARHFFHGHTFTGNALASAAALASLDVFEKEGTLAGLAGKAALVRSELAPLTDHPHVGEVRSSGLMFGIELVLDRATRESFPVARRAGRHVILEARRRGMIIRPLGDVIVFMPPLASTPAELSEMCGILVASVRAATEDLMMAATP